MLFPKNNYQYNDGRSRRYVDLYKVIEERKNHVSVYIKMVRYLHPEFTNNKCVYEHIEKTRSNTEPITSSTVDPDYVISKSCIAAIANIKLSRHRLSLKKTIPTPRTLARNDMTNIGIFKPGNVRSFAARHRGDGPSKVSIGKAIYARSARYNVSAYVNMAGVYRAMLDRGHGWSFSRAANRRWVALHLLEANDVHEAESDVLGKVVVAFAGYYSTRKGEVSTDIEYAWVAMRVEFNSSPIGMGITPDEAIADAVKHAASIVRSKVCSRSN